MLFTCYLTAAQATAVRGKSLRPSPPISSLGMPTEMEYADDVDFIEEEKQPLDQLQPVAAENLKNHNLFMNEAKTECTHVYLADTSETDTDGEQLRGSEP